MTPPERQAKRAAPRDGESSADAVARYVRKLIFEGRLEAGQRLPQDDIAAAVGVSRIPVREAIIALAREGWVQVEAHRGAYVSRFDEQTITDTFALFGRFYGFAARRAAERMTAEQAAELNRIADKVAESTSPAAVARYCGEFLDHLVRVADSNRLRAVLRSASRVVPGNFFETVPGSLETGRDSVGRLRAALNDGDAERAAQEANDTNVHFGELVIKHRKRK